MLSFSRLMQSYIDLIEIHVIALCLVGYMFVKMLQVLFVVH